MVKTGGVKQNAGSRFGGGSSRAGRTGQGRDGVRTGERNGAAAGTKPGVKSSRRSSSFAPVTFFLALIIVALGTIQLVSTFHTYALNLAELNSLRNQEAALVAKKAQLENDIARWDDDAYVTAQARERLGFVFPGERSVRVLHPEVVGGTSAKTNDRSTVSAENNQNLPWYKDMLASFEKADEQTAKSDGQTSASQTDDSDQTGGTGQTGGTTQTK
ncbi:septum formation initiator family protein [Bifidobacterium simiarum]|nr:septum formation initiator family protein [Bifidobacterium simiarum]MBT1166675.1 septum formation initiator family protein [Bifidobacterium simiarum]